MAENETTMEELQNFTADEVIERVGGLGAADLQQLLALEQADKSPRVTVVRVIEQRLAKLASENKDDQGAGGGTAAGPEQAAPGPSATSAANPGDKRAQDAGTAKPAAADETPDWQKPNYDGPLTIPQAAWRREHIKPAQGVRTK